MATYKPLEASDIKTAKSFLYQLIDVIQEDISGSSSRRKYQVFVTGGIGPGITSSMFQTVYDQDFTLQTANAIFDCTVGLRPDSDIVDSSLLGVDDVGKEIFPSSSVMVREKMDNYRQFAQLLLGDSNDSFNLPNNIINQISISPRPVDAALFIAFKRLFARDGIKRSTFAMKFYQTASMAGSGFSDSPNLYRPTSLGFKIYSDIGAQSNKFTEFGGTYSRILDASDTTRPVGLLFYERGIAVLDLEKITSGSQFVSGTIDAMTTTGKLMLGSTGTETAGTSKFIPDFIMSASIDNIVDHICSVRFGAGTQTAITFQNTTNINSTLIFCHASANEFNYSSNPTFKDDTDNIVVIDPGEESTQQTFCFVTSVGLYTANGQLLAVAKLSRPVEKNPERDLTFRVRLDF